MAKLTLKQQEVYNDIMNAERLIIIDNPNGIHSSEKTLNHYINNEGKRINMNTPMWVNSSVSNKQVQMCNGHSSTLKALEKKGLLKIINVGGIIDTVEIDREAPERILPTLNKYRLEAISTSNEIITKYYFSESMEGLQIFLDKDYWLNESSYCKEYKIYENERDFEVRYE